MYIKNCRSCKSDDLVGVLDLGNHPWCGDFLKKEELGSENIYPLNLLQCKKCELLQLNYTVPKEVMFSNHSYLSSTTKTLKDFFSKLAKENKKQFNLSKDDIILDIGGNDGTQMLEYQKIGFNNVSNVESASNIANISKENGINTINEFFNYSTVINNFKQNSVKLINASGVFFHLEELHSVLKGIDYCLKEDGVLIIQFMYAGSMIDNKNFDTIYHEHLCLYTIKSLSYLLNQYDLEIFDAYLTDIHSGSIVAKVAKKNSDINIKTESYANSIKYDEKYNPNLIQKFAKEICDNRYNLKNFLNNLKAKRPDSKIYCFGAPAKGTTLLNYLDIDKSLIDKAVEVNELKIGLYLPKLHIPISKESDQDLPDYYLLLSHNFMSEILKKNLNNISKGLQFIIPFPEIKIINKENINFEL
ncbi:MAG: methyltransferase [Porticoccus sp.]|nr:methyltransferase [Porticoccus sp.]